MLKLFHKVYFLFLSLSFSSDEFIYFLLPLSLSFFSFSYFTFSFHYALFSLHFHFILLIISFTLIEKSYFEFIFGDKRYPALLGNLPCNIETHKTFDHITYYKSGDVAQVDNFISISISFIFYKFDLFMFRCFKFLKQQKREKKLKMNYVVALQ